MTILLPVPVQKQKHSSLDNPEAIFNSLQRKIETLRKDLENQKKSLDESLHFYTHHICPQKNQLVAVVKKQIKLLYPHYKEGKPFSKKQRLRLKEFILSQMEGVFELGSFEDKELIKIFEDLHNVCYKEFVEEEFEHYKSCMQAQYAEEGLDVDLSGLKVEDGEGSFFQRVFEAVDEKQQSDQGKEIPSHAKTKGQLEKEAQKELQKKEIRSIYRQLVKVIHPDLEQDPLQKQEKEKLMAKLSIAYENNDLYTLLSLEMEWLKQSESFSRIEDAERLRIYNRFLNKQVQDLVFAIREAPFHHQYYPLQNYLTSRSSINLRVMKKEFFELQKKTKANETLTYALEKENPERAIYQLVKCG